MRRKINIEAFDMSNTLCFEILGVHELSVLDGEQYIEFIG